MKLLGLICQAKVDTDREVKIKELSKAFPKVRHPYHDDNVLEILFQNNNEFNTLRINLATDFPTAKPVFQVVGPLIHPWLNPQKRVIGCQALNSWTAESSLAEVAKDCIEGLKIATIFTAASQDQPQSCSPSTADRFGGPSRQEKGNAPVQPSAATTATTISSTYSKQPAAAALPVISKKGAYSGESAAYSKYNVSTTSDSTGSPHQGDDELQRNMSASAISIHVPNNVNIREAVSVGSTSAYGTGASYIVPPIATAGAALLSSTVLGGSTAGTYVHAAAGVASKVGSIVVDAVTSKEALGFLSILSNAAVSIPLAGAVAAVLKSVLDAASVARYNLTAASILSQRAGEVGASLADLLQTVRESSAALDMQLNRVREVLQECNKFLDKFSKRNYLSRLIRGESDADNVRRMDKEMGDCVSSIQMTLGVQQIGLQQRALDQLEFMQQSIAQCTHTMTLKGEQKASEASVLQMTPADMEQLAAVCNIPMAEIKDEVQGMCSEILESQARIEEQLERIEKVVTAGKQQTTMASASATVADDAALKFWNAWFSGEKVVPLSSFVPVIEEEYNNGVALTESEFDAFKTTIDVNPTDRNITMLKWKRFCRIKGDSRLMDFLRQSSSS